MTLENVGNVLVMAYCFASILARNFRMNKGLHLLRPIIDAVAQIVLPRECARGSALALVGAGRYQRQHVTPEMG